VQDNDLTARQARSVYNQLGIQPDINQEWAQVDRSPARIMADLFGARDRPSVQQAVEKAKSQYPDLDEVLPHGGAGGSGQATGGAPGSSPESSKSQGGPLTLRRNTGGRLPADKFQLDLSGPVEQSQGGPGPAVAGKGGNWLQRPWAAALVPALYQMLGPTGAILGIMGMLDTGKLKSLVSGLWNDGQGQGQGANQ
jgi:hypothetical protein